MGLQYLLISVKYANRMSCSVRTPTTEAGNVQNKSHCVMARTLLGMKMGTRIKAKATATS